MKILNNIGIIGALLTAIADIICVMIFVFGIHIEQDNNSTILFAIINAIVGIMINILLRYQGQKYAEIENQELLDKFYRKKIKETKHYISMTVWQGLSAIYDVIVKGGTAIFSIYGVIYISIEGSKSPIQILITIVTLIMFVCFGLINMNSSYCRFYNRQIPYMELKIKERENQSKGVEENVIN